MKQRLLVAAIGVPLLIVVLVILPPVAAWILTAAIAAAAAWELLHTAGKHVPPLVYGLTMLMTVLTVAYISMDGWWTAVGDRLYFACAYVFVAALFLIAVVTHGKETALPFATVAVCIVGGLLFPAMYSCIFLLRMDENYGKLYVLAPFCVAFVGDALSMYFGMWFGKRKMAPHVSPHKTWAGAIGGPIGSALALVLLGVVGKAWIGYAPNYLMLILVGVVANIFGQLGDLSMSLVKREAGIKDYSHLFLTHGGMLDRFDSTLFIAPVVWAAVCGGLL